MINRTVIRVRVLQQLYAASAGSSSSPKEIEKEFLASLDTTYDLYFYLLDLVDALTELHTELTEVRRNKYLAKEEDLKPNMRLIQNRLAQFIGTSNEINNRINHLSLSWRNQETLLRQILKEITSSDIYQDYLSSEDTYESDAHFWLSVLKTIVFVNSDLDELLEEQSLYWDNPQNVIEKIEIEDEGLMDIDKVEQTVEELKHTPYYSTVINATSPVQTAKDFVLKSIRRFNPEDNASFDELIIPKFKSYTEREFGCQLIRASLLKAREYDSLIEKYCINWEQDRLAEIDVLIMRMALAEAFNCKDVPLQVTLNEYIELAKSFSTTKSGQFINGVLDRLFQDLRQEKKLIK